ncbi:MAG TPA: beta-ketoacyl-[acyl-carrier-protein] synthase family protein [Terriglobales bacterium]|nr:beta-ketoacyl-[acyl-carrier-protein] synthase family protein [Terriglobales bacterium]
MVTGVGLVSPIGIGATDFWDALVAQRSGIRRLSRFDPSSYSCQVAGEIDDAAFTHLVHPRKLRNSSRATQLGLAATTLALRDAGWQPGDHPPERVGTMLGTAMGGWVDSEKQYALLLERGARRVNPFIINASAPHAGAGEIAAAVSTRGPQLTFANGCPAGLLALADASQRIARGELDAAIAGGAEMPISPLVFAGMGRTNELSRHHDPPATACRPFDAGHDGMVLSEGACILVLEAEEAARARGRNIRGAILGTGSSCDAAGLFDLDLGGTAGAAAVRQAIESGGTSPAAIDYICAHANSGPAFDRKETAVIRAAFGAEAERIPVSSIKGVLGHPFGAAGAFQTAAALLVIQHQHIPPTANLEDPDSACALHHVRGTALQARVNQVLVTSYGYGGVNAALVIARY